MSNYIICGKLDNQVRISQKSLNIAIKIRAKNPDLKIRNQDSYLSVSADKSTIFFNERIWQFPDFFIMIKNIGVRRLLVLTNKERLFIIESAVNHGIRVDVFEILFPIFSDIKYNSRLNFNLDVIKKYEKKLKQLNIYTNSLSKYLSYQHLKSTARKLPYKSDLDSNFFFAYKDPYQEVFKFKEERKDRFIIALDFNSMYLDCMRGDFCAPSSIIYRDFLSEKVAPAMLHSGVYRVRLIGAKPSFFLNYHPFLFKRFGRSHQFQMKSGDTIETLLHKNEVEYYTQFFNDFEIIEGLFSVETIAHPLLKKGLSLYDQRIYHRIRGDKISENYCKISIQHLHSATNQKKFISKEFPNLTTIRDFLSSDFNINFDGISIDEMVVFLKRNKYFQLFDTHQGYKLSYLDTNGCGTIFSLSSQVIANARVKIIKTLERFLKHNSVEICYSNVDSIHLSIHRDELDNFINNNKDIISNELGALKVETIADKGYWFDVGRYWLKKSSQVVLYKNKGFNHSAALTEYVCRRKVNFLIDTPNFTLINSHILKLENSFSYRKKLININSEEAIFERFKFEQIKDAHIANFTEADELLRTKKEKVDLFKRISINEENIP